MNQPLTDEQILIGAKNKYIIKGDYAEMIISKRSGEIVTVLIDTEDIERIKHYRWIASWMESAKRYYISSHSSGRTTFIHRTLVNVQKGLEIDHINHNPLDNRKSNLRVVTSAQNKQNKSGPQKNSKSGVRGVSWSKSNQMWRATVKINGKLAWIKQFHGLEEAAASVKEARKRLMPYSTN